MAGSGDHQSEADNRGSKNRWSPTHSNRRDVIVEIRPSWKACGMGFCEHPRRVIIPLPVTQRGIRRAAYRNGFWDNENPSHGHLSGDFLPSPRNDRFWEALVVAIVQGICRT